MRVLHVITGLNTGGAETVLCRLLESLPAPAYEHVVVALGEEGTLSARVAKLAKLHHLGMRPGRVRFGDIVRLRRLVRSVQPEVIQGWMYHANLMATLATVGLGIPVAWGIRHSLHELSHEKRATRLVVRASAWLSRLPRRIVYNSSVSAGQHQASGFSNRRTQVIANGYDTEILAPCEGDRARVRQELAIAPGALAIGLVARVHPMKDHENFLRAAALLVQQRPDAVFLLVGEGTEAGRFGQERLISELGLEGHVRLCGRRTDIADINNALDIASSSSWGEAFPNAIAEAMACGKPCIATDVGDVRQIIDDTGVVVPPRDPAALAAGWMKLAALGAGGRGALGARARERIVERYSLDAMAKRYADLYSELAGVGA